MNLTDQHFDSPLGETASDKKGGRGRSFLSRVGFCFSGLAIFAWVMLIVVRIFVKDSIPYLASVYYATPPVMLAVFALLFAFWMGVRKRNSVAALWMLLAACCVVWTMSESIHFSPSAAVELASKKTVRVAFWNAARGRDGWEKVAADARRLDADVIGLVEAGPHSELRREYWRANFPDHQVSLLGGGFVLLTKGEASECTVSDLADMGQTRQVDVTIRGNRFRVILVDMHSTPWRFRKAGLEELARQANSFSSLPTVILGDFNTPVQSLHLAELRKNFRNAFEVAGNGYAPTWPSPVPLLMLDQIWVTEEISLQSCELGWSWVSDHRPVIAEFWLAEENAERLVFGN